MSHLRRPLLPALRALVATALVCHIGLSAAADAPGAQRWDLRDLYPTPVTWDTAYRETRERIEALPHLRPTLGTDAATLLAGLAAISDLQKTSGRLAVYAKAPRTSWHSRATMARACSAARATCSATRRWGCCS